MTKIAAIQMASGTNVSANLSEVSRQIVSAAQAGAELIVIPESFAIMGFEDADQVKIAEEDGTGPIQDFLSEQAKNNKRSPFLFAKFYKNKRKRTWFDAFYFKSSSEGFVQYFKKE